MNTIDYNARSMPFTKKPEAHKGVSGTQIQIGSRLFLEGLKLVCRAIMRGESMTLTKVAGTCFIFE